MSDAIIQVDDVSKSYGGVKANVDISLQVKRGSITGIIGPNGCGKTTLFNSIVGYHPIDKGSIKFDGKEISHLRVGDIARLGMLRTFQQTRIYSKMNCVDNMQISVSHRAESKSSMFASRKGEILDRAEHLLEFVGLYSKRNLISGDLSFGQQKLLEFAMALMNEPKALLLDEPTAGINPTLINGLIDRLQRANEELGITLCVIEHNMRVIMNLASDIYCLANGRMLASGAPRCTAGQHAAIGKAVNVRSQVHDHTHIVFNHAQGDSQFLIRPLQPVDQTVDQCRVDTGCRLVEKQRLRFVHKRHGEFQQLLLTKGQITRDQVSLGIKPDELEKMLGPVKNLALAAGEHRGFRLRPVRDRDLHVVDAVHLAVDAGLLEGPQHAEAGDVTDPQMRDFLAVELDRALVDRVIAHDRVEEGGLATTVRADDACNRAPLDLKRDIDIGLHAAIGLGNVVDLDNCVTHRAASFSSSSAMFDVSTTMPNSSGYLVCSQPMIPCWKYTILMIRIRPSATH